MSTQFYDFALAANASQVILAEGEYFKIFSSTGTVEVTRSDGAKYGPISAGQGARNKHFDRLTIRDKSGAANMGFIIVSDADFVDDQLSFTSAALAALARPEQASGSTNVTVGVNANVPETVIAPGANANGLVVLSASFNDYVIAAMTGGLFARATAPAASSDPGLIAALELVGSDGGNFFYSVDKSFPMLVQAGFGLYWLQDVASAFPRAQRSVRYKLL